MKLRSAHTLVALMVGLALAACSRNDTVAVAQAQEITRETACSLDGMTLADYPGPKAQVQYEQGKPDFFCDTVELFAIILRPEQQKRVRAVYVQDMGQADWASPAGHWIDARSALYVAGSRRHGSMGPTLASFAAEATARDFAAKEGGKVYRFDQITPEMVQLDGGVVKDHQM